MKPPIRFGVIGCSSVAYRRFAPAISNLSSARLERIGSRDLQKAKTFAEKFSFPLYCTYQKIICEKPAFPDYRIAEEMVKLCHSFNVRLLENYMFLHHPQHQAVATAVAQGRIGKVRYFSGEFTYPLPSADNIRLKPELNGGVFHDAAGYPVAAAMEHFGRSPLSVMAYQGMDAEKGVDNLFCAILDFGNDQYAQVFSAFEAQYRSRYALVGTKGRIEVERAYAVSPEVETRIYIETDSGSETVIIPPADQFQLVLEIFCTEITRDSRSTKSFEEELLKRHAVMESARDSIQTRKRVKIYEQLPMGIIFN